MNRHQHRSIVRYHGRVVWMGSLGRLVVVDNLDVVGRTVLMVPHEAKPIFLVQADGVLSFTAANERMQIIARGCPQIVELRGRVQQSQFATGSLDEIGGKTSRATTPVDILGGLVGKTPDHTLTMYPGLRTSSVSINSLEGTDEGPKTIAGEHANPEISWHQNRIGRRQRLSARSPRRRLRGLSRPICSGTLTLRANSSQSGSTP